jgi:hypothetical protein
MTMYCEHGACIVAGTQSALNKYFKESTTDSNEFDKRKTRFFEVIEGIELGGVYALDKESLKVFKPIAKKLGINLLIESELQSSGESEFVFIKSEML